ncbi:MAG: NAD-dependent epimerase/dehydratase family protein [Verrucomicrobia bacterium]|nr:NAD-dependent epimerase/dehydratase family protein [Verrucomicrobiota bacterium]
MKIIVTGGAGFIGSHVVRALLKKGETVTIIDNFDDFYNPEIKRNNIADLDCEIAPVDLRDEKEIHQLLQRIKPDAIIHLAARAGVRPSIQNPKLYLETNVNGTLNLLEGARASGCHRFLFASSSSVYGLSKVVPFHEALPLPQTLSPYAATKLAGEQLCGNFSYLYGMRTICLRFFTVYGPAQRPDLAIHRFTDAISHGEPIKQFGDGSTRRDYTYIDDIVQGVLGAMTYERELFDIFNLGENETTTLSALITMIEQAVGCKAIIEHFPEQPGDMPLTCADISKAQRLLGYQPTTPLAIGIPKFVEWHKAAKRPTVPLRSSLS